MKWIAHFKDYQIKQFDDNGNEIKYQEVLDNIEDLRLFVVMDNIGNCYSLDIKTQEFKFNDELLKQSNINNPKFTYYRRNYLDLTNNNKKVIQVMGLENDEINCFIGVDTETNEYSFNLNI